MRYFIVLALLFAAAVFSEGKKELVVPDISSDIPANDKWGDINTLPVFKELEILEMISKDYSKNFIKESREYYTDSVQSYQKARDEIKKNRDDAGNNPQFLKYEWQKKAHEDALDREEKRAIIKARHNSIVLLIKAMKSTDKIKNPEIRESADFIELKASVYREYIKHQVALNNFQQASTILDSYFSLGEKYEKDSEAHKLQALCYDKFMESANKMKDADAYYIHRDRKNRHLLKFTELKYGKESVEYKRVVEAVSNEL